MIPVHLADYHIKLYKVGDEYSAQLCSFHGWHIWASDVSPVGWYPSEEAALAALIGKPVEALRSYLPEWKQQWLDGEVPVVRVWC